MKKLLSFVFITLPACSLAQATIDSVLFNAINRHLLEFQDAAKNYSDNKVYVVLSADKTLTLNYEPNFDLVKVEDAHFVKWKKKDVGRSKTIIRIVDYNLLAGKIEFFVVGGVLTFNTMVRENFE